MKKFPISKTESEWLGILGGNGPDATKAFRVLFHKATEAPGIYNDKYYPKGHFACRACDNPLYSAASKFNAGCGWPAFDKFFKGSVITEVDTSIGMKRVEIMCSQCGGHLGHVFNGERLTDTNERHCVNSLSVVYKDTDINTEEITYE